MTAEPTRDVAAKAAVVIEPADPRSAEAEGLYESYLAEITATFGYDTTRGSVSSPEDFVEPDGCLLVVRDETGAAIGCGGVRLLDAETAEIKRMFLQPSMRGRGAGWQLLKALEAKAAELGASRGVLDTNETLTSALALYRAAGWEETPAYNDNLEATHWFAKSLDDSNVT
jgi:GNAT superfamily N-acetyltransferase